MIYNYSFRQLSYCYAMGIGVCTSSSCKFILHLPHQDLQTTSKTLWSKWAVHGCAYFHKRVLDANSECISASKPKGDLSMHACNNTYYDKTHQAHSKQSYKKWIHACACHLGHLKHHSNMLTLAHAQYTWQSMDCLRAITARKPVSQQQNIMNLFGFWAMAATCKSTSRPYAHKKRMCCRACHVLNELHMYVKQTLPRNSYACCLPR